MRKGAFATPIQRGTMTQSTDTDIRDLTNLITNLDKKLDKLDSKIDNLEIKIDAKIDKLDNKIDHLETRIDAKLDKLDSKIEKLEIKLEGKFDKLDDRTKLSFWGFILRGLVLTALIGVGTYLLPIIAEYVHKLPPL
jgi:predicted RNase H-like nuclease (RuvC/YqgF family)